MARRIGWAQVLSHLERGHLHLPRGDLNYAIEFGLRNLGERRIICESAGQYTVAPEKAELLAFYANSVRHLLKP